MNVFVLTKTHTQKPRTPATPKLQCRPVPLVSRTPRQHDLCPLNLAPAHGACVASANTKPLNKSRRPWDNRHSTACREHVVTEDGSGRYSERSLCVNPVVGSVRCNRSTRRGGTYVDRRKIIRHKTKVQRSRSPVS